MKSQLNLSQFRNISKAPVMFTNILIVPLKVITHLFIIPGQKEINQDIGMATGGLAQLSSKHLQIERDRIPTNSFRLQSQVFNFSNSLLLWLNVYSPTDD